MTPAEFKRAMEKAAALKDISAVKREGMGLIVKALGAGAPAFIEGLIVFMNRLESEPGYTPKEPPPAL